MKFEVTKTINAPAQVVWDLLTDAEQFPEWDPGTRQIDGRIALGKKIVAHTHYSERTFPIKVTTLDAPNKMVWSGEMQRGLYKGVRTFTLTSQNESTTILHVQELFTGLLLGVFKQNIPDLTDAFENFAQGLKERAEQ